MDREKVVDNLTDLKEMLKLQKDITGYGFYIDFINDALALLKEQEAVEPKKTAYQRVDHTIAYWYRCGTCDMSIFPSYKYCPFCGREVKWE